MDPLAACSLAHLAPLCSVLLSVFGVPEICFRCAGGLFSLGESEPGGLRCRHPEHMQDLPHTRVDIRVHAALPGRTKVLHYVGQRAAGMC
jgi:hypothetical protein